MQGHRRYPPAPTENFPNPFPEDSKPGDYWFSPVDQTWYAICPTGTVGSLAEHEVVEHEDSTITVSPSILVDDLMGKAWHGYLEHGIWREV
jgi:hypothetical protein